MGEDDSTAKTVLVAEGLCDSRMFMRMALEGHGYRVVEAETGEGAVEAALRERPDLILLDLHLPGLEGLEAVRRIRAQEASRETPIVATSTSDDPALEAAALEAGCDRFRRQPVDFDKFGDVADLMLRPPGRRANGGGREQ